MATTVLCLSLTSSATDPREPFGVVRRQRFPPVAASNAMIVLPPTLVPAPHIAVGPAAITVRKSGTGFSQSVAPVAASSVRSAERTPRCTLPAATAPGLPVA